MHRALQLIFAALLIGIAAVSLVRAFGLARDGWGPSAAREERWLSWAGGNPRERALFNEIARGELRPRFLAVPPGDDLFLVLEGRGVRADWLQVMAQYAWPAHQVVGVVPAAGAEEEPEPPPGARLLRLPVPATAAEAAPPPGLRGTLGAEALAGLAAGLLVALAAGAGLLRRRLAGVALPAATALALVTGLTVVVPAVALLGRAGLPPPLAALPAAAFGLALGAAISPRRPLLPPSALPARRPAPADPWGRAADVVLAAVLVVFGSKIVLAPLWSWDHLAIWGMKARRLAAAGVETGLFDSEAFRYAAAHYPLGVPLTWLSLSPLEPPQAALFKAAHVLFGVALALLVRAAVRWSGGSRVAAAALAALTAASPLFWDTENLGLADLQLALWAVAAVSLLALARRAGSAGASPAVPFAAAGLVLGFLPWIKQEGWPLAVLLAVVAVLGRRPAPEEAPRRGQRQRALAVLLPAVLLAALGGLMTAVLRGEGRSFLEGDWGARMAARAGEVPGLLRLLAGELLEPRWLGLWLLFVAAAALAAARRRRPALLLAAAVAAQIGVYGLLYLATYLDPAAHLASSFGRIAAALLPLAAVAVGAATAERRDGEP